MANKGLSMASIEDIQLLKGWGISQVKVSRVLRMSRNTVAKYWNSSLDQTTSTSASTSGLPK